MNKKIVLITAAVVIVIVAIALGVSSTTSKQDSDNQQAGKHPSIENQPTMGEKDAPISIVEFGDYKCPGCKSWGESILPKLKADYIDNGKATFSYVNVLFHKEESERAALASESVFKQAPDHFWDFHEALFADQPVTQSHDEVWVTTDRLVEIAQSTVPDLDIDTFKSDIDNGGTSAEVDIDSDLVKDFNIKSTPTIIINGVVVNDPFDYDVISRLIDRRLEEEK